MGLIVNIIPCLQDNYAYLLFEPDSGWCAVVDPSEAAPVAEAVNALGLKLTHILNTHHHPDHIGGNLALKTMFGAKVVGAAKDRARIPGLDMPLNDGDVFDLHGHRAAIMEIPGHTIGHIAYWFENEHLLFTGDTLFAMGCGGLFEGTPEMMWESLTKLAALPDDTRIYCGHEYTQNNGRFALSIEPHNAALQARMEEVLHLRAKGEPTIPTTIALERATNPFLRAQAAEIRSKLGMGGAGNAAIFAELRRRKDVF
jgi:hydroxyacylglutathione hydrolase